MIFSYPLNHLPEQSSECRLRANRTLVTLLPGFILTPDKVTKVPKSLDQLVRAEYPDLISIPRPGDFIQVILYDKEREDAQLARKSIGLKRNLMNQIGLRWIVEAICLDSSSIKPPKRCLSVYSTDVLENLLKAPPNDTSHPPRPRNRQAKELFQTERTLAGHNLFLDLIYFHVCFWGPLPDRVEEFQSILASLYPPTIDTKYITDTINHDSAHYNSSLEDIDKELSKLPSPVIGLSKLLS